MKCSECQHDMIESRVGWLCMNCGHHEGPKPGATPVTPEETKTGVVEATTPIAASTAEPSAPSPTVPSASDVPSRSVNDSPISLSPARQRLLSKSEPAAVEAPLRNAPAMTDISLKPAAHEGSEAVSAHSEPQPSGETSGPQEEVTPAVAPSELAQPVTPQTDPSARVEAVAVHMSELHTPRAQPPQPSAGAEPVSAEASFEPPQDDSTHVASVSNDVAPSPTEPQSTKPALIAATHPRQTQRQAWLIALGGFLAFASLGTAFYWFMLAPQVHRAQTSPTTTNSASVLGAQASPSVSPTSTSSADSRDAKRRNDLSAYAAAYLETASDGYYRSTPPEVSPVATDPTTGTSYTVITTPPSAVGQIQYMAGGSCTGTSLVPGAYRTRQLALYTMLESSGDLICVDVK